MYPRQCFFFRTAKENGDVAYGLSTAYFCIGDSTWPQEIDDPIIKECMTIIRQFICDEPLDLRSFTTMYWTMMNQTTEIKDTKDFNKCLAKFFVKTFNRIFCDEDKKQNFKTFFNFGMYIAKCQTYSDKGMEHATCHIFRDALAHQNATQDLVGGLCGFVEKLAGTAVKHEISKRQFSLPNMITLFKNVSCDMNDTLHDLLVTAQDKFSYLDETSKHRKHIDWDLINELVPEFLCCFADAMEIHTTNQRASSATTWKGESFTVLTLFSVLSSKSILSVIWPLTWKRY